MDTSVREKLESAGIDVAGALERFMETTRFSSAS